MSIPQCFTFTVECVALRDFKEVCSDYCSLRLLPFFLASQSRLCLYFQPFFVPFSFGDLQF